MTDEQLLEEYTKEIHGNYPSPSGNLTVARLIDSHRHLRQLNREWYGAFDDARANGYEFGYEMGLKCASENMIKCDDLRKMTIQELANLIGGGDLSGHRTDLFGCHQGHHGQRKKESRKGAICRGYLPFYI